MWIFLAGGMHFIFRTATEKKGNAYKNQDLERAGQQEIFHDFKVLKQTGSPPAKEFGRICFESR